MKRQISLSAIFTACSLIGLAPIAAAANWVNVAAENDTEVSYHIDLDSRTTYVSSVGWRHVTFSIANSADGNVHVAVAACNPYQMYVPDYGWDWLPDANSSYTSETVGGRVARAACNW